MTNNCIQRQRRTRLLECVLTTASVLLLCVNTRLHWSRHCPYDDGLHARDLHRLRNLIAEGQRHTDSIMQLHVNRSGMSSIYQSSYRSGRFQAKASDRDQQNGHLTGNANRVHVDRVHSQTTVSESRKRAWLAIGIPTIPRPNNENYLILTLRSITKELPTDTSDPHFGTVAIFVVNMHGHGHEVFFRAQGIFAQGIYAPYMQFITEANHSLDPPNGMQDAGTPNKPGWKVRRQTRDLVSLMRKIQGAAKYLLFMEDDMHLCDYGIFVAHYIIYRASYFSPDWLAVRASFGMNGIFIHDADIQHLALYLLKHQARRPPDHLVVEWYAGETAESAEYRGTRSHIGYKYNILRHLGSVSTLRSQIRAPQTPECYDELLPPVVFPVEAYDPRQCFHTDMSPCTWGSGTKWRPPLDFYRLQST